MNGAMLEVNDIDAALVAAAVIDRKRSVNPHLAPWRQVG
jgi:hypothetical protein